MGLFNSWRLTRPRTRTASMAASSKALARNGDTKSIPGRTSLREIALQGKSGEFSRQFPPWECCRNLVVATRGV